MRIFSLILTLVFFCSTSFALTSAEVLEQLSADSAILHEVIHGSPTADVTTEGGDVPTLAKAIAKLSGFNPTGDYANSTAYNVLDLVVDAADDGGNGAGTVYIALSSFTSGDGTVGQTLADEIAAGQWMVHQGLTALDVSEAAESGKLIPWDAVSDTTSAGKIVSWDAVTDVPESGKIATWDGMPNVDSREYATLQLAFDALTDGDHLEINGNYTITETLTLPTGTSGLTITQGSGILTIDCTNWASATFRVIYGDGCDDLKIHGIKFLPSGRLTSATGTNHRIVLIENSDNVKIVGNTVTEWYQPTTGYEGAAAFAINNGKGSEISGNFFRNIQGGAVFTQAGNVTISDNITIGFGDGCYILNALRSEYSIVENNYAFYGPRNNSAIGLENVGPGNKVSGNRLIDSAKGINLFDNVARDVYYTDIRNNFIAQTDNYQQPWQPDVYYYRGQTVTNEGNVYECIVAGTSASSGGPTGTSAAEIPDNEVIWLYNNLTNVNFGIGSSAMAYYNHTRIEGNRVIQRDDTTNSSCIYLNGSGGVGTHIDNNDLTTIGADYALFAQNLVELTLGDGNVYRTDLSAPSARGIWIQMSVDKLRLLGGNFHDFSTTAIQLQGSYTAEEILIGDVKVHGATTNLVAGTGSPFGTVTVAQAGGECQLSTTPGEVTRTIGEKLLNSNSATPNIVGGSVFLLSNTAPTTVIGFVGNPVEGQEYRFRMGNGNTTFDFSDTDLQGNAGIDLIPTTEEVVIFRYIDSKWYLVSYIEL